MRYWAAWRWVALACAAGLCTASLPPLRPPAVAGGMQIRGDGHAIHLNNGLSGPADQVYAFGRPGDPLFFGDWDGDGVDTPMVRRAATLHLRNTNSGGSGDLSFRYGRADDAFLTGDWDGDGRHTPAVRRGAQFHLRNSMSAGPADVVLTYGRSDDEALVGDWDGDGASTLGVRRGNVYHLRNALSDGPADVVLVYGSADDEVLVADWDGDGRETLGVRRGNTFHLTNVLASGAAQVVTDYGASTDAAFSGDWDGDGRDTLGVRRPAAAARPASARLIAGVHPSGRYLLDQDGAPILMHAETAWGLMARLTPEEADQHIALRAEQGYNAMLFGVIPWVEQAWDSKSTVDGIRPFRGSVTELDERYWRRIDAVLETARGHGVTMFLAPDGSSKIFEDTEWAYDEHLSYELGRVLGRRYAGTPGIVWLMGVDYLPEEWDQYDAEMLAFVRGVRAGGDRHPVTVQFYNNDSTSWDNPRWRGVYDLSAAYTYRPSYRSVEEAYFREAVPVVLIESNFEAENNEGGPTTTDESLRRQMIWTLTSGGAGTTYGHRLLWAFRDGWQGARDTGAVTQLAGLKRLFEGIAWWTLVPDRDSRLLVDGRGAAPSRGTQSGGFPDVLESSYATAAASRDGKLAVVYVPTSRAVRLDVGRLAGNLRMFWVDPASGARLPVDPGDGTYRTPGLNAAGDEDWLLVATG